MAVNNRILIIDDDQAIWESYQAVLNNKGDTESAVNTLESLLVAEEERHSAFSADYELTFARQGQEGFEKVKEADENGTPFAVAFIDVRMPPGWNGVDTSIAIREINRDIEIVIVTAFADVSRREMVEKIAQPDKLLYLRKPFDADELGQIALQLTTKWGLADEQRRQHKHIESLLNELQHTRNYLDSIINSIQSIVIGVSYENTIVHWNHVAGKTIGRSESEALGQNIQELIPELPSLEEITNKALQTHQVQHLNKLVISFNGGEERQYEVYVYPLISDDRKGAVIRIDDITERARLEEIMIQSDKMLTVGGLAAGMAHEINTPLGSILQSAQVIEQRLDHHNPKNIDVAKNCGLNLERLNCYLQEREVFKLLSSIRDSGGRTSKIVKSMLSFSHQSTSPRPIQINELIDEALELSKSDYELKKRYRFADIKVERNYAEDLPVITIDRTKMEQVFLNLIKNAAQAMVDCGDERTPIITVDTTFDLNNLYIEIGDNGVGIDSETVKRIFDPFFTTKEIGSGTGLGLSLAYFIINQQHHGLIEVNSELGIGSSFKITLPRRS